MNLDAVPRRKDHYITALWLFPVFHNRDFGLVLRRGCQSGFIEQSFNSVRRRMARQVLKRFFREIGGARIVRLVFGSLSSAITEPPAFYLSGHTESRQISTAPELAAKSSEPRIQRVIRESEREASR